MRRSIRTRSFFALLSLLPATAFCESTFSQMEQARFVLEPVFDVLDCGLVGHVEAAEVDEHLGELHHSFRMTLAFHLGRLNDDEHERRAELTALNASVIDALDADDDSQISMIEYRNYLVDLIESVDEDHDGEVSRKDLFASE